MCHLSEDAADLVSQSIVSLLSYNKWEQIEQKDGLKWVKSVIRRQWFQTLRRPRQAHKRVELVDMHTYEVEHIDPYLWEMLGKLEKRRQYVVDTCGYFGDRGCVSKCSDRDERQLDPVGRLDDHGACVVVAEFGGVDADADLVNDAFGQQGHGVLALAGCRDFGGEHHAFGGVDALGDDANGHCAVVVHEQAWGFAFDGQGARLDDHSLA